MLNERETLHPILSGFAEDLTIAFSKYIGLSVISHYSTQRIKDISDRDAIQALGAHYLVTGSFRMQGDAIRIGIHLIRTSNFTVAFSGQHEEKLDAILDTHDKIVQQIVNVLQQQVDYDLLSFSFKKKTVQLAAYENWLVGKELLKKGTIESDEEARRHFETALEIDPNFARAYSGISLSYFNEWSCQLWHRWDVSQKGAHEYALKALEIDDSDYISLAVLGRTYIFLDEFEKAEHYLRKSLRMNPNDADNLIMIAMSFMFLGYNEEAAKLFRKACYLNPLHKDVYYSYGSNIYLELGQYEEAIELGKTVNISSVWIDFPLYMAGAYYFLDNREQMERYWAIYLQRFQEFINQGKPAHDEEALQWHIDINPYRGKSQLEPFWNFIRTRSRPDASVEIRETVTTSNSNTASSFLLKGELWEMDFQGQSVLLKDAKGYHDIARLLAEPEKEWHCTELMGAVLVSTFESEAIDAKAVASYRSRIRELRADIEEAEAMNDLSQASGLQKEYDQLVTHLSRSLNLKGQARQVGASAEKARAAVTWRIRSAIKKINKQHPTLGRHLDNAIKTGNFCSYQPEMDMEWIVA